MGDGGWEGLQFVVMVIIMAIIAVFTWVRKAIERAQQEKGKGERVDVGEAVREQLKKYMRAAGQLPPEAPASPEAPPRPVDAPIPHISESLRPQPAEVVRKKPRRGLAEELTVKAKVPVRRRAFRLRPADVRRAVLHAEILGPPVSEREEFRLF